MRYHFVGIGGAGMSGLARVLLEMGHEVSGSDREPSNLLGRLGALGARVYAGHDADNVREASVLVVSSAVPLENEEILEAERRGIPVLHRADVLASLMKSRLGIAVAGCHGKTTTTSMIALVLNQGGLDPTVLIGGELNDIGGNAQLGTGRYLVAEADESDGSFLKLEPFIAVITNIEDDHLDHYGGEMERLISAFGQFAKAVPDEGAVILCRDDRNLRRIMPGLGKRAVTYGTMGPADFGARDLRFSGFTSSFTLEERGIPVGRVCLSVPGLHNVLNALGALALGKFLGLGFGEMADALEGFRGVHRRFETVGVVDGITVVDDYAHHPTEVKATLKAARGVAPGRVISVFQPHRYSRTQFLAERFGPAFENADEIIITPIYSAGEAPIPGVTSDLIRRAIEGCLGISIHMMETHEIPQYVNGIAEQGDIVLTMGAGDIWRVAKATVEALGERGS